MTRPTEEPSRPSRLADEVIDDGQEEVFSKTAVLRGQVEDPLALDPDGFASPAPPLSCPDVADQAPRDPPK